MERLAYGAYTVSFLTLSISIWLVAWRLGQHIERAIEEREKKCLTRRDKCEDEFKTFVKTSDYHERRTELKIAVEQRFDSMDNRMNSIEHRMETGFNKIDAMNLILQNISSRLNK